MNPHLPTLATEPDKPVAGNLKTALDRRYRVTVGTLGPIMNRWNRQPFSRGDEVSADQLREQTCIPDPKAPQDPTKARFEPESDEQLRDKINRLLSIKAIEPVILTP